MDQIVFNALDEAPKTGTTIVACVYDGGVVLGADTRVSTGIYVSNRASDKMTVLADRAVMCRSGSAADTEAVAGIVRYHVEQISMERDDPPDVKTVAQIANQVPVLDFFQSTGFSPPPCLAHFSLCLKLFIFLENVASTSYFRTTHRSPHLIIF